MNPKPKPENMAVDWKAETKLERLHSCRVYLLLHGCLTAGESESVKRRIIKQAVRYAKST